MLTLRSTFALNRQSDHATAFVDNSDFFVIDYYLY